MLIKYINIYLFIKNENSRSDRYFAYGLLAVLISIITLVTLLGAMLIIYQEAKSMQFEVEIKSDFYKVRIIERNNYHESKGINV